MNRKVTFKTRGFYFSSLRWLSVRRCLGAAVFLYLKFTFNYVIIKTSLKGVKAMVTENDIFKMLTDCGVKRTDVITIHTSLRAIGKIENGADGLIDGICSYLSDGLLLIPSHTWATVNKDNPYYNVKTTEPCIGTLPKIAASRKDGVRSLHPTHSLVAFGKEAEEYLKGEENSATPAPLGGALSRLYERKGKILLIGVGQERNTYLHAVDERLNIPNRLSTETFTATITDRNGNKIQSPPFHWHKADGTNDVSKQYPNYEKAFEYHGAIVYSSLGNATVRCCDAEKTTDVVRLLWKNTDHDLCINPEIIPESYYVNKAL